MEVTNETIARFMGGRMVSREVTEMPHGSQREVVIETWDFQEGTPPDGCPWESGTFNYHYSFNSLVPVAQKLGLSWLPTDIAKAHRLVINKITIISNS